MEDDVIGQFFNVRGNLRVFCIVNHAVQAEANGASVLFLDLGRRGNIDPLGRDKSLDGKDEEQKNDEQILHEAAVIEHANLGFAGTTGKAGLTIDRTTIRSGILHGFRS